MKALHWISHPVKELKGEISIPGDKSISHRALILGAIAKGKTIIEGFLEGEDCLATIKAFQAMGVKIEGPSNQHVIVHGVGKYGLLKPAEVINCGNSGTTMRLLAGLLTAQNFDSVLEGDQSLQKRPMERISFPLTLMGAEIETTKGKPPLRIGGNKILQGINYTPPQASAQVKSCLLLAGLYAKGKTSITELALTRDHTERLLAAFSYPLRKKGRTLFIQGEGECLGTTIQVPGDLSSAAFFIVAATVIKDAQLLIKNVGLNPTRIGIITILTQMGANISVQKKYYYGQELRGDLLVKYAPLRGISIPKTLIPLAIDEFPIIFIAAACAKGHTLLQGASELRTKESDRIVAMVEGLNNLGIKAAAFSDGLAIEGGTFKGKEVESFHDHRIAMAFAIAGAVAQNPIIIKDCANVATSFPGFVTLANTINLAIKEFKDEV